RLGVLLVGLPHRLLRGVAPAPQVLPHGSNRQPDADPLVDQLADGVSGPERRGDPQLLGGLGLDRLPDALFLVLVEEATGADRSSGAIPGERLTTPAVVPGTPAGDGFLTDSQDGGDVDDGVTQLPGMHGAP